MNTKFISLLIYQLSLKRQSKCGSFSSVLPLPSGPYFIGTVELQLTDYMRKDPFTDNKFYRQLMVQLWYPSKQKINSITANYLPYCTAHIISTDLNIPLTLLAGNTHAKWGTSVYKKDKCGYPVIIYSPGYGSWRNASTSIVEDLVSWGYIVVTIDHTYDGIAVEFINGKVILNDQLSGPTPITLKDYDKYTAKLLAVRVADCRFVIDTLYDINKGQGKFKTNVKMPHSIIGSMDLSRLGMFGHSLGGTTVVATAKIDRRVCAVFDMDGVIPKNARKKGIKQPLLLIQSDTPIIKQWVSESWNLALSNLCKWHCLIHLMNSGHNNFTDLTVFAKYLNLPLPDTSLLLGTINACESVAVERACCQVFFAKFI